MTEGKGNFDFTNRALQIYWVRKRSVYRRVMMRMTAVEVVGFLLERRDKLHGIGSDTAWDVLLTRKPEKYERWI